MLRVRRFLLYLLFAVTIAVNGQHTREFKQIFYDADYLYQTEKYEEAFKMYKNLLMLDPGNSNILYLCGACCLNIPDSEQQAITYLKEAVSGVSQSYKERSPKESRAPVRTYFMLGRAFHLNNEFDEAIQNYEIYQNEWVDEDQLQKEYTRLQIEACKRAEAVLGNAPFFKFQSVLDQLDDNLASCNNPVISGDGNILIFLVDDPSHKKIMMTTRRGKLWSRPRVINSEIGMVGDTYPVCLSYDGKDLYLVHQFYSYPDIYVSRIKGGRWSKAEALGSNINGRYSETHASISKDGKTLYFTSDARGGSGGFDIFVSSKDSRGEWGSAKNLGPVINTPFEEYTPFISGNDSILFFSSQGHPSIGGIDVFYSELTENGLWGEPVGIGAPVNTTGDDVFFNPGWGEMDGYYAVRRESDPNSNDINMVIELEPEEVADVSEPAPEPVEDVPALVVPALVVPERIAADIETERILPQPTSAEMLTGIPFDFNDYNLNFAAVLEVEKIARLMLNYGDTRIDLTGHADASGSSAYNMLLSLQRADRVAQYLGKKGMDTDRFTVIGKGESEPIARNQYPDGTDAPLGRYLNRQVVVHISGTIPADAGLTGLFVPDDLRSDVNQTGQGDSKSCSLTIQLVATRRPADLSLFPELNDITEYVCKDGYYRYTLGAFNSFPQTKAKLRELHSMGYGDTFIQTLEWYGKACE